MAYDAAVPLDYFVDADTAAREVAEWNGARHTRSVKLETGETITVAVAAPTPMICPFDGGVLTEWSRDLDAPPQYVHWSGRVHSNGAEHIRKTS